MMKIRWLSNGLYSLKNCHKQFGQVFRLPPPFWAMPKFTRFFGWGFLMSKLLVLSYKAGPSDQVSYLEKKVNLIIGRISTYSGKTIMLWWHGDLININLYIAMGYIIPWV